MSLPRTRELIVIGGAVGAAVAIAIAAAVVAPAAQAFPAGSSFSTLPDGTAAAYLTLERTGYRVARSYEPLSSGVQTDALVIIADPAAPASNQDRRAVQTFLASGGTVLATGCLGATFFSSADPMAVEPFPGPREYSARSTGPLTTAARSVHLASGCSGAPPTRPFAPLYGDARDAPVLDARIGAGEAVWSAADTPLENSAVETPGHLDLLLNLAGRPPRVVVWNEFYHGQRRSLWSYLARTPAPWVLTQCALAAFAAAALYGRRRLPIRAARVEPRTSPLEFVETMAGLYARRASAADAVALARARLRRLLLDATGLARSSSDERLAGAAASRLGLPPGDLHDLLRDAERAGGDPETTPVRALPLIRRLQTVAAALSLSET